MSEEEWTAARCATEWGVPAGTWRSYVSRGQAPAPRRHVGRTPVWDPAAVRGWQRPGQGARTDLDSGNIEHLHHREIRERQHIAVHEAVAAYLEGDPPSLSEQSWWREWFGPDGAASWRVGEERRAELAAETRLLVDLDARRIAGESGREYDDPEVLAEVDMGAAYVRAAARMLRRIVTEELERERRNAYVQALGRGDVDADVAAAGELERRVLAMLPPP